MDISSFVLGLKMGGSGGGSSVTVEALTATENKTYTAPEGKAYSPVTVNVPSSGASNFVTGAFTAVAAGTVGSVETGYTGNGYPIAMLIVVEGGLSNSANTDWYNLVHRYAIGQWCMTKSVMSSAPTYSNGPDDYVDFEFMHKGSTTSATTYTRNGGVDTKIYKQTNPIEDAASVVYISAADKFKYISSNTSFGFAAGITYRYWIVYSE